MKLLPILGGALLLSSASFAQNNFKNAPAKFSYSVGMDFAKNLLDAKIDSIDLEQLLNGFRDAYTKKSTKLTPEEAQTTIREYMSKAQEAKSAGQIEIGKKFLAENGKRKGVVTLPSGLQYEVMKEGTGAKPTLTDMVTTHYHGTLIDGTVFDSSVNRGEPASFPVNGVITGWTEALQLMPTGSKWKLFVPYNLAYGERGAGGSIGPFTTLIFEVELLSIAGK